jgi:general secretion pathway protein I
VKRPAGFTLLEVLVALAVLAIAMGAIIHAATQSINTTATLRDRTFAGWVARNQVNALLLELKPWPEEGSRAGSAELANRVWRWEARFYRTDDPDLRRLELTVRAGEAGTELGKLVAFKGQPPEQSTDATGQPPGTTDKSKAPKEGQTPTPRQPRPAP